VAATILDDRQIIFFTAKGLVSVAAKTGAVMWRSPFAGGGAAGASPAVSGDIVFVSRAYNAGAAAVKISKTNGAYAAAQLWKVPGNNEANQWSTPVIYNGYIYGITGQVAFGASPLKCIDLATGAVKWTQPGFGPGGVTLADGNLLVLSDIGDLVLIKAAPDAYTELARSHVLAGKCWNSVAISNGRIYARSTKEGVGLELPSN
jgi:outer membrane protein assembly factor BamB